MRESIRPVAGAITLPALMGVRCFWPHNMSGLKGPVVDQAVKLRSVPLCHQCSPRSHRRLSDDSGCRRRSGGSVNLLLGQQRPGNARRLVGKRNERLVETPPFDDAPQPCRPRVVPVGETADNRSGAVYHLLAQIMIGTSTDATQARLTSGCILSGRQPNPGGELSPRTEVSGIVDTGYQRRGDNGPDARQGS